MLSVHTCWSFHGLQVDRLEVVNRNVVRVYLRRDSRVGVSCYGMS